MENGNSSLHSRTIPLLQIVEDVKAIMMIDIIRSTHMICFNNAFFYIIKT